jgi:hypothetical protein
MPDGRVNHPFGHNPVGYIVYSGDGYMSVAFMSAERIPFASGDPFSASGDEIEAAFHSYFSYAGPYEIDVNKVIHHIQVCIFPNWIGVDQERFFKLDGSRLTLSTPPILQKGTEQTAHLIWERV